jgi:hypothetical protein
MKFGQSGSFAPTELTGGLRCHAVSGFIANQDLPIFRPTCEEAPEGKAAALPYRIDGRAALPRSLGGHGTDRPSRAKTELRETGISSTVLPEKRIHAAVGESGIICGPLKES